MKISIYTPNGVVVLDSDVNTAQDFAHYGLNINGYKNVGVTTKVRASNSSVGQSLTAGIWAKITLPTVEFDTLGEFNPSTHRFTAKQAGYYQIEGCINANPAAVNNYLYAAIKVNDTIWSTITMLIHIAGFYSSPVTVAKVYLNVGDFVELWGHSSAGACLSTVAYWNYLSIAKI